MRASKLFFTLLLALALLPTSARADVLVPGQPPPQPAPETAAFATLYSDQFVDFDPAYAGALAQRAVVFLWLYPGAPEPEDRMTGVSSDADHFSAYYRDSAGRFWGYANYFYGNRFVWICLSAPSDPDLGQPADTGLIQAVSTQSIAEKRQLDGEAFRSWMGAAIPVILVVALALAVVIWPFGSRRR